MWPLRRRSGSDAPARDEPATKSASKQDGQALRLMRRREMRRALKMTPTPEETHFSELLAVNEEVRRFPGLLGVRMAKLAANVRELRPAQRNPLVDHPLAPSFGNKGINPVIFSDRRQGAVRLSRYEDISMVAEGGMAVFLRGLEVDEESTGLARGIRDLAQMPAIRIGRAAYIDDIYRPTNPCHVMVDRLPRVFQYTTLAGLPQSECVTVNAATPYPLYALEHVAPEVRRLEPHTLYHFDELFLLSTCARPIGHPFFYLDADVVDFIVPKMTADLPPPTRDRRLYLSRFVSGRRRLVNEDALCEMLARRDFEILEMADLTPREQLAAVRAAETIVAPHGAALASLVAGAPQNRVVELFNPTRGTAAYGAMAVAVDAPYTAVFGTPLDEPGLNDPWRIDVARVAAALDAPPQWTASAP